MPKSEDELARALRENEMLAAENERLLGELREASGKFADMRGSLSWKVTAPLRAALDFGLAVKDRVSGRGVAAPGRLSLNDTDYLRWVAIYDTLDDSDRAAIRTAISKMGRRPMFSFLLVVRDPPAKLLQQTIQSIRRQLYREWELCVVDDGSTAPHVARALSACGDDPRVRILRRPEPGTAVEAEALAMAQGDYVGTLDLGDVLAESALFEIAAEVAAHPDTVLIYSDEDELDSRGRRCRPKFKSGWSPELFEERDYLGRLTMRRRGLERPPSQVRHVPAVLCHRGCASTGAAVQPRSAYSGNAMVSVIIPTRDRAELLERCLEGLLHRTDYPAMEIIVIDNDSREERTKQLFAKYKTVRVVSFPGEFNWSAMSNAGAKAATGEILLFLNNDTDVVEMGWLRELAQFAVRPEIGAVGAKLLFADGTVQHAGIWLGPAGHVRHFLRLSGGDEQGYLEQLVSTRNLSAVTGACLAVRRTIFNAAGGFDESFPVSYSDLDLCLKLKQRGYRNVWTPHAKLLHLESASRGSGEWRWRKEEAEFQRFYARWEKEMNDDPFFNPNLDLIGEEKLVLATPPRTKRAWRP